MALIKCSECGKEVSDKAIACPNCGVPIAKQEVPLKEIKLDTDVNTKVNGTRIFSIIGGIVLIIFGLFGYINVISEIEGGDTIQTASTQSLKSNYNKIKEGMTEAEVKDILGAPNSTVESQSEGLGKVRVKQYGNWSIVIQIYFSEGKVTMKNLVEK